MYCLKQNSNFKHILYDPDDAGWGNAFFFRGKRAGAGPDGENTICHLQLRYISYEDPLEARNIPNKPKQQTRFTHNVESTLIRYWFNVVCQVGGELSEV